MDDGKKIAIIQEARICLLAGARIKDSADPADALLVLLSAPLSDLHGRLFVPAELVGLVKQQFGWEISTHAIEAFMPKMRGLGWLDSRTDFPARGPFYVNLPEPEIEIAGQFDTHAALTEIGSQFQSFAENLSPFKSLPDDPAESGALLLKYVVDSNVPVLTPEKRMASDVDFLCARFIDDVNKNSLPVSVTISSLSAVGFLLRVAEEVGNPSTRRSVDLRIIIDGPILLDILGCSGALRKQSCLDIFEPLRAMGAQTITFDHCVREAQEALRSVLKTNPRDRYGPTGDALRKGHVHENALISLLAGFDTAIRARGITILPDDLKSLPMSHKYFDSDRVKGVEQMVNWHDSDNENARFADSDTTVLTIRRRVGFKTTDLFSSKFVCVTTNETFAGATRRHLIEILYYNQSHIPPVISLKEIAAKLWLEVGNSNGDKFSLPNSQLLVSCERALRFNRKVVDRARAELQKVRPEQLEQFELLLEVPRSARAVMDLTLNNERYVSGDNIEQLVEAAIEAAAGEVTVRAKEQRKKDREKHKNDLEAIERKFEEERQVAAQHEESARVANEERTSLEIAKIQMDADMIEAAEVWATKKFVSIRRFVRGLSIVLALIPAAVAAIAFIASTLTLAWAVVAAVTAAFAAAAAMDRPGAWLSKVIQRYIESNTINRLRSVGRYDLAELMHISWSDGVAHAGLPE